MRFRLRLDMSRRRVLRLAVWCLSAGSTLGVIASAGRRTAGVAAPAQVLVDLAARMVPLFDEDGRLSPEAADAVDRLTARATLVALGESTHGTHEFFAAKRAIIEHFVRSRGTKVLAIEAPWSASLAVDAYLTDGVGTPENALAQLRFWTWNTDEFVDLIKWLREYNASATLNDRVHFVGIDPQLPADRGSLAPTAPRGVTAAIIDAQYRDMTRLRMQWWQGWRRDRSMGANAITVARAAPNAPVLIWAHDGHIQRARFYTGGYVSEALGESYVAIGLVAALGRYNALRIAGARLQSAAPVQLPDAPERSIEHAIATVVQGPAFLDVRGAVRDESPLSKWLRGRIAKRSVGAVYTAADSVNGFYGAVIAREFDGLVFIPRSTPSLLRAAVLR